MSRLFDALHNAGNDVARKLDPRDEATRQFPSESTPPVHARGETDERLFGLLEVLHHVEPARRGRLIALMGVQGGEGTTAIARDLAEFIARQTGDQVLLLESEAKRPDKLPDLNAPGRRDTVVTLCTTTQAFAYVNRLPANCACATMLAGSGVDDPEPFFDRVTSQYHWVIMDCPPVLHVDYQKHSARLADGTILIAESERTETTDLDYASKTLKMVNANLLGVVLNKRSNYVPSLLRRVLRRFGIE